MLGAKSVMATIGVKDMERASSFYKDVLGLETVMEDPHVVMYKSGDSMLSVYVSEYAGTNQATTATWDVEDIDLTVADLKAKGVTFEHYEGAPDTILEGDVHIMPNQKAAWFKDPDGNILCLHAETA